MFATRILYAQKLLSVNMRHSESPATLFEFHNPYTLAQSAGGCETFLTDKQWTRAYPFKWTCVSQQRT